MKPEYLELEDSMATIVEQGDFSKTSTKIRQSDRDRRKYRVIRLENNLQAFLISDSDSDEAAIALDIEAGSNLDPVNRPGLMHFLEHVLFLGNQKYPSPQDYSWYVDTHGGKRSAYVTEEHSTFRCSVNATALEGAMDRFSALFVNPLFDPVKIAREVKVIAAEDSRNRQNEARRIQQVEKETIDPTHPFHHFSSGNAKTLWSEDAKESEMIITELKSAFEAHYRASRMKLAILGNHSLDILEAVVREHFSSILDHSRELEIVPETPYSENYLRKKIGIVPKKNLNALNLVFPLPNLNHTFREKPVSYLARLLKQEESGGLLHYLKQQRLITSLRAGFGSSGRTYSSFSINMNLTPGGVRKQDQVIEAVFQYLRLIADSGIKEEYFQTMSKMANIYFDFAEKEAPIDFVTKISHKMHEVPAEEVLRLSVPEKFNSDLIRSVLNLLNPERVRVMLVSKTVNPDREEQWYGVPYRMESIAAETLHRWNSGPINKKLKLPAINPFIPEKVNILKGFDYQPVPKLLLDDCSTRLWFKGDHQFSDPKVMVAFKLFSPKAGSGAENALMTKLFGMLLRDSMSQLSWQAMAGGIAWQLLHDKTGLEVRVHGFPEKLPMLFEAVLNRIKMFTIDPDRFELFRQQLAGTFKNQERASSLKLSEYEARCFLVPTMEHFRDNMNLVNSISLLKMKAFLPKLLTFSHVEGFVSGNISEQDAMTFVDILNRKRFRRTKNNERIDTGEILELEKRSGFVLQQRVKDTNSSMLRYYQLGKTSDRKRAMQQLLVKILKCPFCIQFRNREPLAYSVQSGSFNLNGMDGFQFRVQSAEKNPEYLERRVEAFIQSHEDAVASISLDEFNRIRKNLSMEYQKSIPGLSGEFKRNWEEISTGSYRFDRFEQTANALKTITREDLLLFYRNYFLKNPKTVSIRCYGANHPINKSVNQTKDLTRAS